MRSHAVLAIVLAVTLGACHTILRYQDGQSDTRPDGAPDVQADARSDAAPVVPAKLRLIYGTKAADNPLRARTWQNATADLPWGEEEVVPQLPLPNKTVRWVVHRLAPAAPGGELAAAVASEPQDDAPILQLLSRTGSNWQLQEVPTTMRKSGAARRLDLAYESLSGEGLLVYGTSASSLGYRTFSKGAWSDEKLVSTVPPATNGADWVRLAADPTSDEITLAYADATERNLHLVTWDGKNNAWLEFASSKVISRVAGGDSAMRQGFDIVYEGISGALILVYGSADQGELRYARRAGLDWTDGQVQTTPSDLARNHEIHLAAEPGSKRVAGLDVLFGGNPYALWHLALFWDGKGWTADKVSEHWLVAGTYSSHGAVGWVGGNGTGCAVAVYEKFDGNAHATARLSSLRWKGGSWVAAADVPVNKMTALAIVQLAPYPDGSRAMAAFSDTSGNLWSASTDCTDWTVHWANQVLLEPLLKFDLASTATQPFALAAGHAP